jgi:hypothetical protein
MRRFVAIALLIPLLGSARADIYRSVDAQGHVQYSDTPSPGAELVYSGDAHGTVPSAVSESSKLPSLAQRSEQISQDIAQQSAARAVERDTADAHGKQCQQARQQYQQAVAARRLYKVGSDGERQYMSDDEAEQQRVKYKLAMDTACEGIGDQSPGDAAGNNGAQHAGSANSDSPAP